MWGSVGVLMVTRSDNFRCDRPSSFGIWECPLTHHLFAEANLDVYVACTISIECLTPPPPLLSG